MKKNSGQVLILFILILPLIFMLLGLTIDVGFSYLEKRKVDNVVNEAINYAFNNEDNKILENAKKYINKNIDEIDNLNVVLEDDAIKVELTKKQKSLFNDIFNKNNNLISSNWYGYKENNKIKIIKQ